MFISRDTPYSQISPYTLPKFWRYNKASLWALVPLEILVVSTRFNSGSLAEMSPSVYTVPKSKNEVQHSGVQNAGLMLGNSCRNQFGCMTCPRRFMVDPLTARIKMHWDLKLSVSKHYSHGTLNDKSLFRGSFDAWMSSDWWEARHWIKTMLHQLARIVQSNVIDL